MTDQGERYDRIAVGYERWWAPVLAPSASLLLDRIDPSIDAGARDLIDIGVGTGNLALAAVRRWPTTIVTGIDASSEMLVAADRIADGLLGGDRARFRTVAAVAADLPFADGAFDLAMSSFVLQLVPSRPEALREIRRVLRPGGTLAYVTWLADRTPFAPDGVFDRLLADFGFEDEPGDDRSGDVPSAAHGRRRAAARRVSRRHRRERRCWRTRSPSRATSASSSSSTRRAPSSRWVARSDGGSWRVSARADAPGPGRARLPRPDRLRLGAALRTLSGGEILPGGPGRRPA